MFSVKNFFRQHHKGIFRKFTAIILLASLSFTVVGCNSVKKGDATLTYSDTGNNAIWQAVYERLTDDYGCSTGYNALRAACSNLEGDKYDSYGSTRSGKRIESVKKSSFNSYTDMYALTLTDGNKVEFALVNELYDDGTTAYDVFVRNNPSTTLEEDDFVTKMANGDLYATLTIDANDGTYGGETEYTAPIGTIYTLSTPENGDYVFLGWYTDDGASDKVIDGVISIDYDCTVYAKWEKYDYTSVDYTEWDSLSSATVNYLDSYYEADYAAKFRQFISDVNALRGNITQAAVDGYCNKYNDMLEHGEFVQSDVARVYIEAYGVNKDAYEWASVIVTGKEGSSYSGFCDRNASIKIRGNSTASNKISKKSYNFKLSSKRAVMGMASAKKWCLLANAMDKTLMRNAIAYSLAQDMGFAYSPSYEVVEVYLNGRNLGCYMLVESIDIGSQKVDIDNDNGDALLQLDNELSRHDDDVSYFYTGTYFQCLGLEKDDDATVERVKAVKSVVDTAEAAIATGNQQKIEAVIDVDSFVNYYLLCEFCKDIDATISSKWFYIKDGILYAGPPWDYDLSMGNPNTTYYSGSIYYRYNSTGTNGLYANSFAWFSKLTSCQWFSKLVAARYTELKSTIESYYTGDGNFIDTFYSEYEGVINRNYSSSSGGAGWSITEYCTWERVPDSTYNKNVDFLRTWLAERDKWLYSTLLAAA